MAKFHPLLDNSINQTQMQEIFLQYGVDIDPILLYNAITVEIGGVSCGRTYHDF